MSKVREAFDRLEEAILETPDASPYITYELGRLRATLDAQE